MVAATGVALGGSLAAGVLSPAAAASPIPTGSLTGKVVGPGGAAIAGATVSFYRDTDADGDFADESDGYGGSTSPSGDFLIGHLPAGNYRLRFAADGYEPEYYLDAASLATGTTVTVGAGNTALAADALAVEAPYVTPDADTDVTGVVTDSLTGAPIARATVMAYDASSIRSWREGVTVDFAMTDSAGRYDLDGLEGVASVKIEVSHSVNAGALSHQPAFSNGAKTWAEAAAIPVTPGTAVTTPVSLVPSAGVTGRVVNPAGVAPYDAWVSAYDVDTSDVSGTSVRADGTFYLDGLTPGETYRIRVTGASDYPGNDLDNGAHYYLDVWYTGSNDFTHATPITAGAAGTFTPNINVTLGDSLVALDPPGIAGDFRIGSTLTGSPGRWNRNAGSVFTYEWLRNGVAVAGGPTYVLSAADAGASVALRVTNTNVDPTGQKRVVSATTAPTVAKYASTVSAKATKVKKGKKRGAAKVSVTVKAGAQAAAGITGTVQVTEGKKKVARVTVANGRATFYVAKPGKHRLTLSYSGNASTLADDGAVTVKVKKPKKPKKKHHR